MKRIISKGQLSIFIVLAILILDQTVKILVKKICIMVKVCILQIGFTSILSKITVWLLG